MAYRTYRVPSRFGTRELLLMTSLVAVVVALTQSIEASLRIVAPGMGFVLLVGMAQMVFGNVPRLASAMAGVILFPVCAWIDPWFEGQRVTQAISSVDMCWLVICGGIAGYLGGALLAGIFLVADHFRVARAGSVYSVPRRFGTGTLLLATTVFAVLFAILQYARARPEEMFFYTAFVGTVSVSQMVFERSPRWASILAGGVYLPLSMVVIPAVRGRQVWRGVANVDVGELVVIGLCVGYIGGALIAGIFLGCDFTNRLFFSRREPLRES